MDRSIPSRRAAGRKSACRSDLDFIQFTDPHLFEKANSASEEVFNLGAFAACIDEANRLHRQKTNDIGKGFDFVIVTGDLGLEELDKQTSRTNAITSMSVVAEVLRFSLITNWFFVPGNNDILGENPENIGKYHAFIDGLRTRLAGSICVSNLCPPGMAQTNSASAEFQIGRAHFIGFDNACFKSDGKARNATNFHGVQLANIGQVAGKVSAIKDGFAYIFYHIPEIDDPFSVSRPDDKFSTNLVATQRSIGNTRFDKSGWIVLPDVRDEWDKIVDNPAVKGLIAGHFHSDERAKYENLTWTKTSGYRSVLLDKLYVCPPVACKRQTESKPGARGFRVFSIDADSGKPLSSEIVWYEGFNKPKPNIIKRIGLLLLGLIFGVAYVAFLAGVLNGKRAESSWAKLVLVLLSAVGAIHVFHLVFSKYWQ